jgi:hypothetical protein
VKNKRGLRKAWLGIGLMLALVLAVCSVLPALAQTGPETMNFQGHLLDGSGNPRSGETHCMRFRLCTNASSQAACTASKVWPVSTDYEFHEVTTESGTYKAGLFTVVLGSVEPIPPQLMYDHDTLYVGIGVADEPAGCDDPAMTYAVMDPPGQLRSSAYAQRSRRVNTEESDDAYLISVGNTGQGGGVYARTDSTTDGARAGFFYAYALSGQTYGVYGRTDSASNGASAVYGEASQASGQVHGLYGKTNSAGGYGVYGTGPQVGVRGVGNTAGSVTPGVDVGVLGDSASGDGVWGVTDSSAAQSTGVRGQANSTSPSGPTYGVYGYNRSWNPGARGVFGYADAPMGETYGVYGQADATYGTGVYGQAYGSYGTGIRGQGSSYGIYGEGTDSTALSYGLYGLATGSNGYGVLGMSYEKNGVQGESLSTEGYGVLGTGARVGVKGVGGSYPSSVGAAPTDIGVWGDSGTGDGVWGITQDASDSRSGVLGWAKSGLGKTFGVWGYNESNQDGARGVYGFASASHGETYGVYGETNSNFTNATGVYGLSKSGATYGVWGETQSITGLSAAVYGYASQAEGMAMALVGRSAGTGDILRGYGANYPDVEFRVENDGDVYADGSFHGGGADFAEMLPAVEGLEAGDVLAIGPDGSLVRSSRAYQPTVVGVYSTQPGFLGGASEADDPAGKVPLAVVGVVPVKVSAENGPIRPGDLLVASATPGHAMRAGENPPQGTVIGKALASWERGVGVIQMLVTLQ